MKRFATASLLAAFAIVATASAGQAQVSSPISFGVSAGASLPTGDLGDDANTGYHAAVHMGFTPPTLPVGFRLDGMFTSFGAKGGGSSLHIWSGTGNVTWSMPSAAGAVSPYLIGGIGIYNLSVPNSGVDSQSKFGWNAGAGINMPLSGFKTFIEARYHGISTEGGTTSFIPISFGIMF